MRWIALLRPSVMLVALATISASPAAASPESSLQHCQQTVQKTASKFTSVKLKAVGTCLGTISRAIIQNNSFDLSAAAITCAAKLSKVGPTEQKMVAKITTACDPAAGAAHTLADIRGIGAGVSEPIATRNIDVYCATFGGDGALDSMAEWLDCIKAASNCGSDAVTAAEVPRALEWFDLVRPAMAALIPTPTDALATLDATNASIEGRVDDDVVGIRCGHSALTASGQQTSYVADTNDGVPGPVAVPDDGTLQFGAPLRFVDNGDGTVTDVNTGLIWEKKSDDGGLHDRDNVYRWTSELGFEQETVWDWVDDVNAEGGTGFAGRADWRIPNVKELQSIVDYERVGPAVGVAFDSGCAPGCSALSCSCTSIFNYWSSSTSAGSDSFAWVVVFDSGVVDVNSKESERFVRAVRGGS